MKNRRTSLILLISILLIGFILSVVIVILKGNNTKSISIVVFLGFSALAYITFSIKRKFERYLGEHHAMAIAEKSRLDSLALFVNEISNGNFNSPLTFDTSDALTTSLVYMKGKLQHSEEDDRQRSWTASGLTEIADLLRTQFSDSKDFYNAIIKFVVKYTRSNQGSLFLINSEGEHKYLELTTCYAYDRQKFLTKRIDMGEGLTGQVVLEKRSIHLKQIPANYVRITSGLGGAQPRSLLIIPLKCDEEVMGVLELASFENYLPHQITFIEKLGERIASSISSRFIAERTEKLLADSLQNAENLKSKEEEMRQSMEELQAIQEEMIRKEKILSQLLEESNRKEAELQQRLQEIEQLKEENLNESEKMTDLLKRTKADLTEILNQLPAKIFLKDNRGYMLMCNAEVARAYNLTIEQLVSTHDRDHFPPEVALGYFNEEQEIMKSGKQTFIQEEVLHGRTRYLQTTKMPFFIQHLNETGLLGYQFDVTAVMGWKEKERQFIEQIKQLKNH
jgi:PAS domain-containing protein